MSVFIIAEAGVNHNGSIELAKELIDVAVKSGADAVKFQTFKTENLVSKKANKAEYQKATSVDLEKKRVFFKTTCKVKNKVVTDGEAELFVP